MSQTSPLGLPTGARHPRVDYHPPYELTFGPEAIALAQAAGLFLDPWQQDSLTHMLAVREDGKWTCFECAEIVSRQNGKGSILEARVLAGFVLFDEKLILWSAHEYKTAIELFLRLKQLIRNLIEAGELDDDDIKVIHTNGEQGFERLSTGQRIKFVARSKDSGRGFSGDLVIIDEAYAYTRMQQSALMPTMSARPNPQIVYASSPPLDGESGEVLFALRKRGDSEAPRDPEDGPWVPDPSLSWRDWGLSGTLDKLDLVDLSDPANWAASNPALGIRITAEFVAREFRGMGRVEFARERCGIWPASTGSAGAVLDPSAWRDMIKENAKRLGDVALAIDVAPLLDHGSIGLYAPEGAVLDGGELLPTGKEHVQCVAYREGIDWIPDVLAEFVAALDPICVVLDSKNGAHALLDQLADRGITVPDDDQEAPRRGQVLVLGTAEVADAVGQWIRTFRAGSFQHPGDKALNVAVDNAKARPIGDAGQIAWGRKISEVDIGPLCSVTWPRYGFHAWKDLVTDYDLLDSVR